MKVMATKDLYHTSKTCLAKATHQIFKKSFQRSGTDNSVSTRLYYVINKMETCILNFNATNARAKYTVSSFIIKYRLMVNECPLGQLRGY